MDFKKLKETLVEKFKPTDKTLYTKSPNYRVVRDWFIDCPPDVPEGKLWSLEDVFAPDDKLSAEALASRNKHREEMSCFVYKYIETPYVVSNRVLGENIIWKNSKLRTYLRNIWRFRKSLSVCHVFDADCMYELLIDQLNQMIPFFEADDAMTLHAKVRAKEMRIFRRLLMDKVDELRHTDNLVARYNLFHNTNKDYWEIPFNDRVGEYIDLIHIPYNVKYKSKEDYIKIRKKEINKRRIDRDELLLIYFKKIPMWWD